MFEAAETEKAQRWIGISFGPSILVEDYSKGLYLNTVLPYKSHIKAGYEKTVPGLVVDWPRRWRETRNTDPFEFISRLDIEQGASEYYATTSRFIEFSRKNHDWFKSSSHLDFG